jgi:DUF917 family protein
MRELTIADADHAVLGGGVFACGGGGWQHHGELMGRLATSLNRPVLATVDELPDDAWVATVTAIGAPAAPDWEIRPVDYVHALQRLIDESGKPIAAVITGQNGYSTTLNGWIQSSVLGVKVLDAAGDVRAHPTGKLGALGLTSRAGYQTIQVVSGGNRALHGHFTSVNIGDVVTCDDVLRDISVRTGGFIAAARNPVELSWVKEHAALGAISLALDLGEAMEKAATNAGNSVGIAVIETVCATIGATIVDRGPLHFDTGLVTNGGWDRGTFRIGDHTVPYLNEYMTIDNTDGRIATYPDTIAILRAEDGFPLAVKDAREGMEVVLIKADATTLPLSSSAVDPIAVGECERLMDTKFLPYLPKRT